MFPTAAIVFREVLEVSLVLGIVMAATKGLPNRGFLALIGLAIGVLGSVIIAFFTGSISQAIDGIGQEIFNAVIMFVAVGFLSWTVVWMKTHGRDLAQNLNAVGQEVAQGSKSFYVLIGVIALATFREGAEVVLFTYSMSASGAFSTSSIIIGGLMGAASGAVVGFMLYFGLLKTMKRHLLSVTSWMLIVLTAGMAAHGASFLIAAGVLPELGTQIWDSSNFISGHGFIGKTLNVLVGYTPRPTGMELAFYVSTLLIVGLSYKFVGRPQKSPVIA